MPRPVLVWLGLALATLASAWLGSSDGTARATAGVLAIALGKAVLVGLEYMELRSAPLPMRLAFEAWALATGAALIVLYVA